MKGFVVIWVKKKEVTNYEGYHMFKNSVHFVCPFDPAFPNSLKGAQECRQVWATIVDNGWQHQGSHAFRI